MPRCGPGRMSAFANAAAGATDTVVVAAVVGKRIRVTDFVLSPASATPPASVTFNSKPAGAGVAITATFGLGAPLVAPGSDDRAGWFETNLGEGLTVSTGAGTNGVGVQVVYEERA